MTHEYLEDPRNASILIDVNGELVPRDEARVSVFDSGFMLGDGVWEGLRVVDDTILFLEDHLVRLYEGMHTLDIPAPLSKEELSRRLYRCLAANAMREGVHVRLMVTRGVKSTPYQDPRVTVTPATVVIVPEFKTAVEPDEGLALYTVYTRRGHPDVQDPILNTHSKLNCIIACIQATKAGADEALMLDPDGFVATCNSTHFFVVRHGELWTSAVDYCLDGITRRKVLELGAAIGMQVREKRFSLHDVYNAEEAFVTGTFAGLSAVKTVDGRVIGAGEPGPVFARLTRGYAEATARYVAETRASHAR